MRIENTNHKPQNVIVCHFPEAQDPSLTPPLAEHSSLK